MKQNSNLFKQDSVPLMFYKLYILAAQMGVNIKIYDEAAVHSLESVNID